MIDIKKIDPNTCLFQAHGYELYDCNGTPFVIHRFTKRKKLPNGEMLVERKEETMGLDHEEAWGSTVTAISVRLEMLKEWKNWNEWNTAMKGG